MPGPLAQPSTEHISLESEPQARATPNRPARHKIRTAYSLHSRLRGCSNDVAILDEHFLSARCTTPDAAGANYVIDLRFANPKPVIVRQISWFWLAIAVLLIASAAAGFWLALASPAGFSWTARALLGGAFSLFTGMAAALMFLRRTTESLSFTSVHGEATLVSITGGIGSARAGRKFFVEVIKNINAAKLARPQPKAQWLRDEMREHHRLRELGVLSATDYEASKARILAAHS